MKKFFLEFKEFALKGNVINLAVGLMIGGAFQGIITSLTENILSPILGLLTWKNFDTLELGFLGITLRYGAFLTTLINFFLMAIVIFLIVRAMNRLLSLGKAAEEPEAAPTSRPCPYCKTDIPIEATRCPACTSQMENN